MASASGTVPDVSPSQILSVSPSLPTNKLLDNLTVKHLILFFSVNFREIHLEKSKNFTILTPKLRKTTIFY
jgi:hypothetical protein